MLSAFFQFVLATFKAMVRGTWLYFLWLGVLVFFIALGGLAYAEQLGRGMATTALSDQIPWGAYIANFTYLAGTAAAVVLLLVFAYAYKDEPLREVIMLTELLAVAVVIMTLLFVVVDLGHPERFWHLAPMVGRFNFPSSMLAWDVVLLNGYLLFNGYLGTYFVFMKFVGKEPKLSHFLPAVLLAVVWAVAPVTAFLYAGLAARPYWNASILAPRFLASALAAGPALVIVVLTLLSRFGGFPVKDKTIARLRQIAGLAMLANLFLYGAEVFAAFYSGRTHELAPFEYMFFGLHGETTIVPYTWAGLVFDLFAATVMLIPALYHRRGTLFLGCAAAVVGVWIEKGIGLLMPGFVPTTLGEVTSYIPSIGETCVSAGIWATGGLIYTLLVKATMPIALGKLRLARKEA
jgi:Ni/Fe-hydrogenase subunit HybB-like protein